MSLRLVHHLTEKLEATLPLIFPGCPISIGVVDAVVDAVAVPVLYFPDRYSHAIDEAGARTCRCR